MNTKVRRGRRRRRRRRKGRGRRGDEEEGEEEEEEEEEKKIPKNPLCYECICSGWRRHLWNGIDRHKRYVRKLSKKSVANFEVD